MKANRLLPIVAVLLALAAIVLSVRIIQLRRKLAHAELYVQSGVENWEFACMRVSKMLREHERDPGAMLALRDIANACIPHSDYLNIEDADAVAKDMSNPDPRGLIQRIDRAIETSDYFIVKDKLNGDFPKGY